MPRRTRTTDYELKRKNPITLGDDSNIEANLKPFKIDSKNSILELSESELKVRGTIDASAITVDGASVQTGDDVGAITALNSATANELVTVGATTTELDAEANLTFDGDDLAIAATGKILFDGGTHTYIAETADDILDFYVGTDKMLALDEANDKITIGAGRWVAGTVSGGTVTEFSAANSAYAGMILGYTCVGANVADDSYTLTTSLVCFQDSGGTAIKVSFITPPSEYVEIEAELFFSAGSGAQDLILSISDNATYASNGLASPNQFEKRVCEPARGNGGTITQKWLLQAATLEAIGSSNNIFIAAACDGTTGTPIIKWGGDATDEYTNLVLKATALPATIVEGS